MCESITVSPADRRRLVALVKDRNAPQKHIWRAEIVLLSRRRGHECNYASDRQVEDLRLALAGAVCDGRV